MRPEPTQPGPGQESVWDYPRPPRLEETGRHIQVIFNGVTIAETRRAKRVLETSHPPTYYIPPEDIMLPYVQPSPQRSFCEWKGQAIYYTIVVGDRQSPDAGWYYANPTPAFATLKDHVAFYAGRVDACYIENELVIPQPGGFYGGWITSDIVGPFKGEPGSYGW